MSKTVEEIGLIVGGTALAIGAAYIGQPELSVKVMTLMIGIGTSTALAGVGLALRPTPKPVGTNGLLTLNNGINYRRVIYGQVQTAGVTTFVDFPPDNNTSTDTQELELVYTLCGHEITSFDCVVIDGTPFNFGTDLVFQFDGAHYAWFCVENYDLYYEHLLFEFDFGRNESVPPFPVLNLTDESWTSACIQQNCAKVHVQLRADASNPGLFQNGRIPNIQFLVTGKKLIDPRIVTAWVASTAYVEYNYVIDNNGVFWIQTNTSGTSGSTRPAFETYTSGWPHTLTDGGCSWTSHGSNVGYAEAGGSSSPQGNLVNGRLMNDAWGAGTGYPEYIVIESPFGYYQMQTAASGTAGTTYPTWATTLGGTTSDGTGSWVCLGRSRHALNPSNNALAVNDYLQNSDWGMGATAASIDTSSVQAAANVCEEQVAIIVAAGGGGGNGFTFPQSSGFHKFVRTVNSAGVINSLTSLTSSDSVYNANFGFGSTISGMTVDSAGNLYMCDPSSGCYCVWKVNTSGVVTRIAGTGSIGSSGNGGPALSAKLTSPQGIAVDSAGNVYICDLATQTVRAVNTQSTTQTILGVSIAAGDIQTVAGTLNTSGYSGDGGPATSATLNSPRGIALDASGNLYVCDGNYAIRKVLASTGYISTFAGTGTSGYTGEGGAATSAEIGTPLACCFDPSGNFYFSVDNGPILFALSAAGNASGGSTTYTGTISLPGSSITGASNALVGATMSISGFSSSGNNFGGVVSASTATTFTVPNASGVAESHSATGQINLPSNIRKVNTSGNISTYCGTGVNGYAGDGGPATSANIKQVYSLFCDSSGNLYLNDYQNNRIRQINVSTGNISTVAGTGTSGDTGDTGAATSANISSGLGLAPYFGLGAYVYENLYACDGMFDQSSARGNVLAALCGSMAGWVIPPGGMWHVFAGAYVGPSVSLGDGDLRGAIKGDFRLSKREVANSIQGSYNPGFLPINGAIGISTVPPAWQSTSFPAYQANGSVAGKPNYLNTEDGGQVIWQDLNLDFTKSLWMAQRLAKIAVMRLRFQQTLTLPCKLTALAVGAGDTFAFTHPRWGISDGVFQAENSNLVFDGGGGKDSVPAIGVDLVGRQVDPSIYTFIPPSSPTNYGEYSPFGITGVMTGVE